MIGSAFSVGALRLPSSWRHTPALSQMAPAKSSVYPEALSSCGLSVASDPSGQLLAWPPALGPPLACPKHVCKRLGLQVPAIAVLLRLGVAGVALVCSTSVPFPLACVAPVLETGWGAALPLLDQAPGSELWRALLVHNCAVPASPSLSVAQRAYADGYCQIHVRRC